MSVYRSAGAVMADLVARAEGATESERLEAAEALTLDEADGWSDGMTLLALAESVGAPPMRLDPPRESLVVPGLTLASCAVLAAAMRGSREPICERCIVRRICRHSEWVAGVVVRELPRLAAAGLVARVGDGTWEVRA